MKTRTYPDTYADKELNRLRRLAAKEEMLGNPTKASRLRRKVYDLQQAAKNGG